jgi:signal transduction histidine kinase
VTNLPLPTLTLQRALLATVSVAILAGMVPAALTLDHRLASALETRARLDLSLAPRVLADRNGSTADMLMMHAKDFAHVDGLAEALARNDHEQTLALVDKARLTLGNIAIVVGPDGRSWTGPPVDSALIALTRAGKMPVVVRQAGDAIEHVALAPVVRDGHWVGAAGLLAPVDAGAAGVLSGLTRSDVVILSARDGSAAATTLDTTTTRALVDAVRAGALTGNATDGAHDIVAGAQRRLVVTAPLGDAGIVLFTRALADELAVLPELRRVALISAVAALVLALTLGGLVAARVARPVELLSEAAQAIAEGEFGAPLPASRIHEVKRVSETFDVMRQALALRLAELRRANDELVDRNARMTALQADLMQRDRLTATGRLVAQLAHEIRNPVANLRNCLELIRRRVNDDPEAREFTDLAIDELLRMHELAEQMLDLNRPRAGWTQRCCPAAVAREVATLSSLGQTRGRVTVTSADADDAMVPLAPDALKQVLVNLVQNARDALHAIPPSESAVIDDIDIALATSGADMSIEVRDRGPGIREDILTRIFDPFFTTKDAMHGVGLGLFVAEGLVRTAGGRLSAGNRHGGGAWFRVELPLVRDQEQAVTAAELVGAS